MKLWRIRNEQKFIEKAKPLYKYYLDGHSMYEVAEKFGVDRVTVYRWFHIIKHKFVKSFPKAK